MNVAEFCEQIKRVKEFRFRSALLIGFDGTASLLGHVLGDQFHFELTGNRATRGVANAWQGFSQEKRYEFFLKMTRPTSVDKGAIACIAQLMHDGYVDVVLACDPHRCLSDHLRTAFPDTTYGFELVSCATCSPNLHIFTECRRYSRLLLLNTSEVLMAFLREGIMGHGIESMKALRDSIQTLLADCQQVFCWGWCNANWSYNELACNTPQKKQELFVLGPYTDCTALLGSFEGEPKFVETEWDQANVNTALWYEIGKHLFGSDLSPTDSARTATRSEAEPSPFVRPVRQSVLLWPAEVTRELCAD